MLPLSVLVTPMRLVHIDPTWGKARTRYGIQARKQEKILFRLSESSLSHLFILQFGHFLMPFLGSLYFHAGPLCPPPRLPMRCVYNRHFCPLLLL